MTDDLTNTITISAEDKKYSATVVVLHGLGDTSDGWLDTATMWADSFRHIRFILPTAPAIPVTLNGGMSMPAWYDIVGLSGRDSENCEGIEKSVQTVVSLIDKEKSIGIEANRIMLAGFSQGGALSLYCGLQLPMEKKLAGILVMSGYLPGHTKFQLTKGMEEVPVFHTHGSVDQVVQYSWASLSKELITNQGLRSYELKAYSGLGHGISQQSFNEASKFIARHLPELVD